MSAGLGGFDGHCNGVRVVAVDSLCMPACGLKALLVIFCDGHIRRAVNTNFVIVKKYNQFAQL